MVLQKPHLAPTVPYRPTSSSSRSPAPGRNRLQMSMVKSVLLLLKMEVSDDMSAAIITAIISPRRPAGRTGPHCDPARLGVSSLWPCCGVIAPMAGLFSALVSTFCGA